MKKINILPDEDPRGKSLIFITISTLKKNEIMARPAPADALALVGNGLGEVRVVTPVVSAAAVQLVGE